jgi:hypothetical protein
VIVEGNPLAAFRPQYSPKGAPAVVLEKRIKENVKKTNVFKRKEGEVSCRCI